MAEDSVAGTGGVLPLGSVVYLRNGVVRMLIVGRFNLVEQESTVKPVLFEYAAVRCPVGFSGEKEVYYFNAADVDRVVFRGFDNGDDEQLVRAVEQWKEDNPAGFEVGRVESKA